MARVLRALSGKTQEQTAEEIGVHPSLIAQIELGKFEPSDDQLERMAASADITLADAEEILLMAESLQRSDRWQGQTEETLLDELNERLRSHLDRAWQRLASLRRAGKPPRAHLPSAGQGTPLRRRAESDASGQEEDAK